MENFVELREQCIEKVKESRNLLMEFASEIIKRDIRLLMREMQGRLARETDSKYVLNGNVFLLIRKDGCIEIEDRRGTAFLWLFEVEIECPELVCTGVIFHNGESYQIERLAEHSFEGAYQEVEKHMRCVEKNIEILKATRDLDTWHYHYEHEYKRYDTLYACVQRVLERKPENW